MKKGIISLVLFVIVVFCIFPSTVIAALKQPPGQFPVTEPLQSVDVGTKPNYSGNIQAGKPTDSDKEATSDGSSLSDNSAGDMPQDDTSSSELQKTEASTTDTGGVTTKHFKIKLSILIIIVVVLLIAGLIYRRRKSA